MVSIIAHRCVISRKVGFSLEFLNIFAIGCSPIHLSLSPFTFGGLLISAIKNINETFTVLYFYQ